ncbi:Na(+)/H(+) antiporter subunit C [Amnibacterium setariae]|uniref:Na(+)/H(+) antiporter subunit C n=1 Tax=Amnibacterium setariae TaxID=2306585 RepID=A0A3A1TVG7_9MICO|nr:Na(+)/H(+) antiporter subunit C [Amnibacterium setariae]RIX28232.1 Na(+)/H(+) antiporter subunit C [Amnibacterium setariae]
MSVSIALLGAMAVLYACGVYLLLDKSVTRIIIGVLLIGNATNLLLLSLAGPPGAPPIAGSGTSSDPLPQALILTAIVITFAVSAFLMALVYRSWRLAQEDRVERDAADVAIGQGDAPEPEEASADEESEFDRPGAEQ